MLPNVAVRTIFQSSNLNNVDCRYCKRFSFSPSPFFFNQILARCHSIPFEDLFIRFSRGQNKSCNAVLALINDRLSRIGALPTFRATSSVAAASGSVLSSSPGVAEACALGLRLWALELVLKELNSLELDIERLKFLRRLKEGANRVDAKLLTPQICDAISERRKLLQLTQNLMVNLRKPLEQYEATVSVSFWRQSSCLQ